MRDATHSIGAIPAISAAVYAADNTPISIDRQGNNQLTFLLSMGVGGITFTNTNRVDFIMEHSDDGTVWTPVDQTNVLGATADQNGVFKSLTAAAPNPIVSRVGYVDGTPGEKRYVRIRADFSGTHGTGTPIAAIALLGEAKSAPVAA